MEKDKPHERFMIANITWNDSGWRSLYINPRAGHAYAKQYPGHESLNFEFNKQGLDTEDKVFGYVQWTNAPVRKEGITIFFYTKNLRNHRGEIVGIYGNSEILKSPKEAKWDGFKENMLNSNIVADKKLSLLFPVPLDVKKYSGNRRIVPYRVGFRYIDQVLAERLILDEIEALKVSGMRKDEFEKLTDIFEFVTGKKYSVETLDHFGIDEKEQDELAEEMSNEVSVDSNKRKEIIKELNSLTPQSPEIIEYKGRAYKRDNKTVAQLKILRYFKCQICNNNIIKKDGSPYIEAAHIRRKSDKGTEMPNNILILCPNHHKEFDLGDKRIVEHTDKGISFELNRKRYDLKLNPD